MQVIYKDRKIEKVCTRADEARKRYGMEMAEKIQMRLDQIAAADSVEMMVQYRIGRCHQLNGQRHQQFAVDLVHPVRLVFELYGETGQVVKIMEIIDYH